MKDNNRYVIWLDYFNSELKRSRGRRVPLALATRGPSLDELTEACRRLNLQPAEQLAKYPMSATLGSGYVSVAKHKPKGTLVLKIAKELGTVRSIAQKKQSSAGQGRKK
ncbi:MAG: signal recognition particle protein Srp19 [Thaumarchaeota archaeon]|nr:signal recognition particle protein Srp19 [Nitrososphaerota archaeon]